MPRLCTGPPPPPSTTPASPTPTRGMLLALFATPSSTPMKLRTALRPSLRCASRQTPTATPRENVWESLCCKSNVPQITKKRKKEQNTNKKAQETKTRPHLLSDSYYQLLAAQNSSSIRCDVNVYLPS